MNITNDFVTGVNRFVTTKDILSLIEVFFFAVCGLCVYGKVREGKWSGQPDSNRRPSAWQADALPTELYPR